MLYGNGFGSTSSAPVRGSPSRTGKLAPLPVVTIGAISAIVQFAGLVSPGLFQCNVLLPSTPQDGDQRITATSNGRTTQADTLITRLPLDVCALLKRAAEMQGRTLTDFVVTAARDAAHRTIEEAEIIRLSVEDQRLFSNSLLNPPEPRSALRRAFERRNELLGPA